MELKLNEKDFRQIINLYYKNTFGADTQLVIEKSIDNDRFGPECVIDIIVRKKITILGKEVTATERLSFNDIERAVKETFAEEGYDAYEVKYDCGIKSDWEGYGMDEHQVTKPYFNGITVKIKENVKVKKA